MQKLKAAGFTELREEPTADAAIVRSVFPGEVLFPTGQSSHDGSWVKVEVSPLGGTPIPGWVRRADCEELAEVRPELALAGFVKACVIVERTFNLVVADPVKASASADYLLARALIETGLKNAPPLRLGSDGVGPLQVTTAEWDAFLGSEYHDGSFSRLDRDRPVPQIYGAAHTMLIDLAALADLAPPEPDDPSPFVPNYLDVLHVYLTGSAQAALAIRAALKDNQGAVPITEIVQPALSENQANELLVSRKKFFADATSEPKSLADFVAATEAALDAAFVTAYELVRQHSPEDLPLVTVPANGRTPWFDKAVAEEEKGISIEDAADKDVIRGYFSATDHPIGDTIPNWCGAFVAHCIKTSGHGATVPKGAAAAKNWKGWGVGLPLRDPNHPVGAVVVLSPEPGSRTTGHVGFFVRFVDGAKVELLGGNQGGRVKRSRYAASRIVAVRWIDSSAPAVSGGFIFAHAVPGGREDMARLILAKFEQAGLGQLQQAAALANAIGESRLDPKAHNTNGEDSVGLFQLNRKGGLGKNFTVAQLKDPEVNISIIIDEARKHPSFVQALTLAAAVDAFVRKVERPKNPDAAITKRLKIAEALLKPA